MQWVGVGLVFGGVVVEGLLAGREKGKGGTKGAGSIVHVGNGKMVEVKKKSSGNTSASGSDSKKSGSIKKRSIKSK